MELTINTREATVLELRQAAGLLLALAESAVPTNLHLAGALVGAVTGRPPVNIQNPITHAMRALPGLAAEDNPSAGAPTAREAFGGQGEPVAGVATTPPTPAAAFGQAPAQGPGAGIPLAPAPAAAGPQAGAAPTTPAAAPSAPAAPSPVAAGGVEVDIEGLPWDPRIHAKASKGPGGVKNADGTWRVKRGLNDEAKVNAIKRELKAAMGAPAPHAPVPPAPFIPGANVPAFPNGVPPAPAGFPIPPAPVASAPAAPVPPAPVAVDSLPALMKAAMPLIAAKRITQDHLAEVAAMYGAPTLPALTGRPDLCAAVWEYICSEVTA